MITLKRTTSDATDFINLVALLDNDLKIRDGKDHDFYNQFNKTDKIKHVVIAYKNDIAVGCGAFREKNNSTVEIKRMFVHPDFRKNGIASYVLTDLENWASELNYEKTILETGKNQPEAIALYLKSSYQITPNYPPYELISNSVCMQKTVKK
jgi:putative acetyltransferase